MRYDLDIVCEFCREIGLSVRKETDNYVEVDLGEGAILYFENAAEERDCLIGLTGVAWHVHDDFTFTDARGHYVELDYLEVLAGLKDGLIIVGEREVDGQTVDRWLIHTKYNDEFEYLEAGERIVVRRAATKS